MVWPVLIVATLSSVLAGIACFTVGLRKLSIVIPTQFITSVAVTYAVAVRMTRDTPSDLHLMELFWTCVLAATFVPMLWLALRQIVGPLQRQRIRRGARD